MLQNPDVIGNDHSPSREEIFCAAKAYVRSGLSLIPIRADGTKVPAVELLPSVWLEDEKRSGRPWRQYKSVRPTFDELYHWFGEPGDEREFGLAIIGGAVSGGLEIIDCDNWEVAQRWVELVEIKAPGLLETLVQVHSPRPGLHAYYRCEVFGGNTKLARVPDLEKENKSPKTIIELKGEGGYCLAPPSPAACHKTHRCYSFGGGKDLTQVPTISTDQREILLACARKLNCWTEPARPAPSPPRRVAGGKGLRPGDDFNIRGDWAEILEPCGWRWVRGGSDGSGQWRRPGKSEGISATTNFGGSELIFIFSSNAPPFDDWRAYTKFHAYALLYHAGDFTAAARALKKLGYGGGGRARQSTTAKDPFAHYAEYALRSRRPD